MRARLRFLLQGRFWLNYVFILAVTSWVPLLKQTATMTASDGTVLKKTTMTVRAWRSWYALFTQGPGAGQGQAVAIHLGLCFIITAFVWFLMFKPMLQELSSPNPDAQSEDNAPVSGDAPHE
jgi:hypothetical protein